MKNQIITIDGQAGAGKGTVGRRLADMFGWYHFDSGSLYRAFAYAFTLSNLELSDLELLKQKWVWDIKLSDKIITVLFRRDISEVSVSISKPTEISFHTRDEVLYAPDITKKAAQICWDPELRKIVDAILVQMPNFVPIIMDGRDLGVSVFPEANMKIYLTADVFVRAQRKLALYNSLDGLTKTTLPEVYRDLKRRDELEEAGPLKNKPEGFYLDTTKISADEATDIIARRYLEQC